MLSVYIWGASLLNKEKLEKLFEFYKQYKALSEYIDQKYKLTLNDLAVLDLAEKIVKRSNVNANIFKNCYFRIRIE